MRLGIFLSALFHVAVLLATMVGMTSVWDDEDAFKMIPVEIVTIAEETNVIAASKVEAIEEEVTPPPVEEQKFVEAAPPPPPPVEREAPAEDAMPPLPEVKPEPEKVEPQLNLAKARPRRKPKPPAPEKNKEDFSLDQIAALLDKTPQQEPKPQVVEEPNDALDDFLASLAERDQQAVGLGNDLTISEVDALTRHIYTCWRLPAGAANPEELVVDLKIHLSRDGTLAVPPEVISKGASSFGNNTFARAAEDAARRAVVRCAPYDFLPDNKYERWRVITMTFDPARMIGK